MIRVTIELVPGGNETKKRTIAFAEIINRGTVKDTDLYDFYEASCTEVESANLMLKGWQASSALVHRYSEGCIVLVADALNRLLRMR